MITLHEEIVEILKEAGSSLNTGQISDLVNKRANYIKKDGTKVIPYQIYGRTKNYPHLFDRNGNIVSLSSRLKKMNEDISPVKVMASVQEIKPEIPIDYSSTKYLISSCFIKIGILGDLLTSGLPTADDLDYSGCYAIEKPNNYTPEFFTPEEAATNGNVISPWSVEKLKSKWIEDADIVYFGIAGIRSNRSLRKRLTDLINHGNGRTTDRGPHKGGEILWQLKGYESFAVWILPFTNPRQEELSYLVNFHNSKGKLPFANRQF